MEIAKLDAIAATLRTCKRGAADGKRVLGDGVVLAGDRAEYHQAEQGQRDIADAWIHGLDPAGVNWLDASARKRGTVTIALTLLIAVIATDSAVSPRERCVSMLAIIPPGDAPSRTSPTASSGGRSKSSAIASASRGRDQRQVQHPDRGETRPRRKSAGLSVIPRLHMITAIAAGRTTEVNTGPSIARPYLAEIIWNRVLLRMLAA